MKTPGMNRGLALFLQVLLVLVGLCVLTFMLWEPHFEGRNAHATTFEVYFKDPFLAYVYVGSLPFFLALCRAYGLLGDVRRYGTFSQVTLDALRVIKRCALTLLGFVAGGAVFILPFGDKEDRPPGVFMCLLVAFAAGVLATGATVFARKVQSGLSQTGGIPA